MNIKNFEKQYNSDEDLFSIDQFEDDNEIENLDDTHEVESVNDFNSAVKEDQNSFHIPNEDLLNQRIKEFVDYLADTSIISKNQAASMMKQMKNVENKLRTYLLQAEFQPSIVVKNSIGNQILGVDDNTEDNDSIVFQWSGGTFGNIQENILASFLKKSIPNVVPWPGPVDNFRMNEDFSKNHFSALQNKNKFPDINIGGINMDFKACYSPGSTPTYNNACGDQYEVANAVIDFLENKNSYNYFGGSIVIFTYYQVEGNIAKIVGFKCVPMLMCLVVGKNGAFSIKWSSNMDDKIHNGNVRIYLSSLKNLKNFDAASYVKRLINAAKLTLGKESTDAGEELQNSAVSL